MRTRVASFSQSVRQVRESLPHKKPPPIPWEGLVVRPGTYRVGVSEEGIPGQLQGLTPYGAIMDMRAGAYKYFLQTVAFLCLNGTNSPSFSETGSGRVPVLLEILPARVLDYRSQALTVGGPGTTLANTLSRFRLYSKNFERG